MNKHTWKQAWCYWRHGVWHYWWKHSGDFEELRCNRCSTTIVYKWRGR